MFPCEHPHPVWIDEDGKPHYWAYCQQYRDRYGDPPEEYLVGCYHCDMCRLTRASEWMMRIMHETRMHPVLSCWFVTLTYDREHLPPRGWLRYRDFQLFMKRLRKRFGDGIRFFMCAEYGTLNHRPHFHAILFGLHLTDLEPVGKRGEHHVWHSQALQETWGCGLTEVGSVTSSSAAYVARYALKGNGQRGWRPPDMVVDGGAKVVKSPGEFTKSSRRPGIGMAFYEKWKTSIFPQDRCVIDGYPAVPPKAYLRRLVAEDPVMAEAVKAKRAEHIAEMAEDLTPRRRADRAFVALARLRHGKPVGKDRY